MTIELVLAIVGLVGAALTAGRVVFSTEVKVSHIEKAVEDLKGKAQAMDALANEGKTAHFRLQERHDGLAEVVATKASAESVINIKESLDRMPQEFRERFNTIDEKLDDLTKPTPRKR